MAKKVSKKIAGTLAQQLTGGQFVKPLDFEILRIINEIRLKLIYKILPDVNCHCPEPLFVSYLPELRLDVGAKQDPDSCQELHEGEMPGSQSDFSTVGGRNLEDPDSF